MRRLTRRGPIRPSRRGFLLHDVSNVTSECSTNALYVQSIGAVRAILGYSSFPPPPSEQGCKDASAQIGPKERPCLLDDRLLVENISGMHAYQYSESEVRMGEGCHALDDVNEVQYATKFLRVKSKNARLEPPGEAVEPGESRLESTAGP